MKYCEHCKIKLTSIDVASKLRLYEKKTGLGLIYVTSSQIGMVYQYILIIIYKNIKRKRQEHKAEN